MNCSRPPLTHEQQALLETYDRLYAEFCKALIARNEANSWLALDTAQARFALAADELHRHADICITHGLS